MEIIIRRRTGLLAACLGLEEMAAMLVLVEKAGALDRHEDWRTRLTDTERQILRDAARDAFGDDVTVMLFGRRVDDSKRGGDIELLVCLNDRPDDVDGTRLARQRVRYQILFGLLATM